MHSPVNDITGDSFMPETSSGVFDDGFRDYRCTRVHGITQCGVVRRHGRWWFVKSLAMPWASMTACRARLEKEYEILVGLNHPGIVRVIDFCDVPGAGLSIVSELISGEALSDYMKARHPRHQRRLVADGMMEAVAYLHSIGVVHLDLKPDNVMVAGYGNDVRVKIIDFGLSDSSEFGTLKEVGGTRAYGAPEQWAEGYEPSPQADVYSLGKILRELKCGGVRSLVAHRAMSLQPDRRFRSAGGMLSQIYVLRRRFRIAAVTALTVLVASLLAITLSVREKNTPVQSLTPGIRDSIGVPLVLPDSVPAVVETSSPVDSTVSAPDKQSAVSPGSSSSSDYYETEHDRLLAEIAEAYDVGLERILQMEADTAISPTELKSAVWNMMPALDAQRRFVSFINACPKSVLDAHPLGWQSYGSSSEVMEAHNRFSKEQNRIYAGISY